MAMKLNAGDVGRADEFLIDPKEIEVVDALNGRWQPHATDDVENMVKSFETEGQLQAVQVRRVQDNKVQLVLGYRRYYASKAYNERHPDNPMKLKCKVVLVNDEEAFRRNIVENRERKECSAMDDAHSQNRLRENFGWTDTKIAEFYKMTPPYVGTLKKLLTLSCDVQKMVHERTLSVQAACELTNLPVAEQQQILSQPAVTSQEVVAAVRDKKIASGGKGSQRSIKEIRKFFEGLTGCGEPPAVKVFADDFLKFIQGKIKDETMEKRLRKVIVVDPVPETAPVTVAPVVEPIPVAVPESVVETAPVTVAPVVEPIPVAVPESVVETAPVTVAPVEAAPVAEPILVTMPLTEAA
jgi:ParB/RepB/Spo0J family partition protein